MSRPFFSQYLYLFFAFFTLIAASCSDPRAPMELPANPNWSPLDGRILYDKANLGGVGTSEATLWIRAEADELMTPHQASLLGLGQIIIQYGINCPDRSAWVIWLGELLGDGIAKVKMDKGERFPLSPADELHTALYNAACHP